MAFVTVYVYSPVYTSNFCLTIFCDKYNDFNFEYFQCIPSKGNFPQRLETSKNSPIFEEGKKQTAEHHRPISVISTVAKLFEK